MTIPAVIYLEGVVKITKESALKGIISDTSEGNYPHSSPAVSLF